MSISMVLFVWVIYLLMFSVVTLNVKLYGGRSLSSHATAGGDASRIDKLRI